MVSFQPLLSLEIEVEPAVSLGLIQGRETRVIPFRGGSFHGATLRGRLLPGGSDWQQVGPDGALEIRARYLLETTEGERIEVQSEGVRTAPPEVLARMAAGELLPASAYYFRTAIRLRSGAPGLARLNGLLAFSIGQRLPDKVQLEVYELL